MTQNGIKKEESSATHYDTIRSETGHHGNTQENVQNFSVIKDGTGESDSEHYGMTQENVQNSSVIKDGTGESDSEHYGMTQENVQNSSVIKDGTRESDSEHYGMTPENGQNKKIHVIQNNDTSAFKSEDQLHSFLVEEDDLGDNSVAMFSQDKMDELDVFRGDTVLLKGKQGKETLCVALTDHTMADDRVRINRCVRNNLCVKIGDVISIVSLPDVDFGKRIYVLPIDDTVEGFTGDLFQDLLKPYFFEAYRPICKGDVFKVENGIEFKVIDMDPTPYCTVAPETVVHCEGEPVKREEIQSFQSKEMPYNIEAIVAHLETAKEELKDQINTLLEKGGNSGEDAMMPKRPKITMDDIGGLEDAKRNLLENIMFPLKHPEMFGKFDSKPSYTLLHGPPNCGKAMLAEAVANECSCVFLSTVVAAGKYVPYTDELRRIFQKARECAPCVLHLDLCNIADRSGKKDSVFDADLYLVNMLLSELDGLNVNNSNLFVIGSVISKTDIDPSLLRPGRLSNLIPVPLPDEQNRVKILKAKLRDTVEIEHEDLEYVAKQTRGFTGGDLKDLCVEAMKLARCKPSSQKQDDDEILKISRNHFEEALKNIHRSLSDDEVVYYEKVAQEKDNFLFGFPRPPKKDEEYSGYKMGQLNDDDDEDNLYGNSKTTSHLGQEHVYEEEDDDDLYS